MRRVLLATDGSKFAEHAAEFLSLLPRDGELGLTVVTVLEAPYINSRYPTLGSMQSAVKVQKARAEESLKRIEQIFDGAAVSLRSIVREGEPGVAIAQIAKEQAADLIVLGARGHSAVSRLLLGSTSDFVATHAHCSVLIVRPTKPLTSNQPLRVAIGYEETGPAQAALEEFIETPWGSRAEVDVVSVLSFVDGFLLDVDRDTAKSLANEESQSALDQLKQAGIEATAHLVEDDHVGEGLLVFAIERDCDLIVMGETPRNFLGRILLGSTSRYVLRHAPCSVWITRNRVVRGLDNRTRQATSP